MLTRNSQSIACHSNLWGRSQGCWEGKEDENTGQAGVFIDGHWSSQHKQLFSVVHESQEVVPDRHAVHHH